MKYSFICVYNDQRQLNDMLLCSLTNINSGGGKTLLIDNSANRYKSCAEAYNKELALHRDELGDVLVFLHQDIAFDDNSFLVRIQQELANEPNQILGFAGMPKEGRTVSNLKYQRTGQFITGRQVQTKTEVCSIDECCFAMTKDLYERLCFDEQTCSHWHLYAVDLCYAANIKFGTKSYVLPETIYHKKDGTTGLQTDRHFLWTMWKMTRKYRRSLSTIYTPCYIISTNPIKAVMKIFRSSVKNVMKR